MTNEEKKIIRGERLSELLRINGLCQIDITKKREPSSPLYQSQVSEICSGKRLLNEQRAEFLIEKFFPKTRVQYLLGYDDIQAENELREDEETRSKTVEELIAEKKRIEEQIRGLKCNTLVFRRAKFGLDPYVYQTEVKTWSLMLKTYSNKLDRWQSIIRATNKQDVINAIPEFIADLTGLYKMLTGIDKEEK